MSWPIVDAFEWRDVCNPRKLLDVVVEDVLLCRHHLEGECLKESNTVSHAVYTLTYIDLYIDKNAFKHKNSNCNIISNSYIILLFIISKQ